MEPVQQVLGKRAQVELQFAHSVTAIGKERDGLVHLQSLRLEQFRQPPLGFRVVVGDEAKALGLSIRRDAFVDDHLEPAGFPILAVAGVDIAAVDADRQRAVWTR